MRSRRAGGTSRHRGSGGRPPGQLAYSRASNLVVQAQPRPDSCRARGRGLFSLPDRRCTPGALNPEVRQNTIDRTICVPGWTSTVRPGESITEAEKRASLAAKGDTGPLSAYEYDHLIPLELGGATNDERNLWPEPGASPNPKDATELRLRQRVCAGQISLAAAQRQIASNWVRLAGATAPARTSSSGPGRSPAGATCTVHASYSGRYHDYDVYVRSDQPDREVTVTDGQANRTWHTDANGYADVYFPRGGARAAAGEAITVRVGGAVCHGRL